MEWKEVAEELVKVRGLNEEQVRRIGEYVRMESRTYQDVID
jgi:hypothetical protein